MSLRLGLIEEYEKHSEPLPIILDDVFVNADPRRTKIIASVLEKFAKNRQIIIFTCHPNLAFYFSDTINKVSMSTDTFKEDRIPTEFLETELTEK